MRQSPFEIVRSGLSRREFLEITALSAAGLAAGCATNPVTGQSQLMLVSENQEIQVDRQNSPQQFSSDYGTVQDKELNAYIDRTGKALSRHTHRPDMPYSFRAVNATYVNAYAFPGGSIAATRGILLKLDNEAELASLLGHELGHVNARHTAQQMTKGTLTQAVLGGLALYAGTKGQAYGQIAQTVGMLGAGALLASYSRDNEREADALGMAYMVEAGYGPQGFVGLMEMLNSMSKHKAGGLDLMFATHPMSQERYDSAVKMADVEYRKYRQQPLFRERYMDSTARLRAMKDAIEEMQEGEELLGKKKFAEAEEHLKKALARAPDDYAGQVMMAKCQIMQKKLDAAEAHIEKAKQIYPEEGQAQYLAGYIHTQRKKHDSAYDEFSTYDRLLPGNPNTAFFKGYNLEQMGRNDAAAKEYYRYLQSVKEGDQAQYAYQRLKGWGYVK